MTKTHLTLQSPLKDSCQISKTLIKQRTLKGLQFSSQLSMMQRMFILIIVRKVLHCINMGNCWNYYYYKNWYQAYLYNISCARLNQNSFIIFRLNSSM